MPLKCRPHMEPSGVPCIRPPMPMGPERPRLPVMTVNGARPDAKGNVEVDLSGIEELNGKVARLGGALSEENLRAVGAENALSGRIAAETSRAQNAEQGLRADVSSAQSAIADRYTKSETDAKIAEAVPDYDEVKGRVAAVEAKIPDQATDQNQLADKAFVNSSIATNTATFRGTYNLVTDLSLTPSATDEQVASAIATKLASLVPPVIPENNDYCFVRVPYNETPVDPDHIERIDRYKCTVVENGTAETRTWGYEFSLNNSSFTAAQWAAINSGITSGAVAKLDALPTAEALAQALASKFARTELFPVWTANSGYIQGDIVIHENALYISTSTQSPAAEWDPTKWSLATGAQVLAALRDYTKSSNKPRINNVELAGNKTAANLGLASTADATLTERGFSEWTCDPATITWQGQSLLVQVKAHDEKWAIYIGSGTFSPDFGNANTTEYSYTGSGPNGTTTVTATRTALQGYKLGDQDDKPLASEAEAEALRTGKQDALSQTQLANIAAVSDALAFDATHSYAAGDPVVYNGTLYTFTATHTGAWTGSDVSAVDIIARLAGKLDTTSAAPAWVSGTTYTANALVTYNGVVYSNTGGGTFVSDIPPSGDTNWAAMKVSDLFLPLTGGQMTGVLELEGNNLEIRIGNGGIDDQHARLFREDLQVSNGAESNTKLARYRYDKIQVMANGSTYTLTLPLATGTLALLKDTMRFSPESVYTNGDLVFYGGSLYRCTQALITGAWDPSCFAEVLGGLSTGTPTAPTPTAGDSSTKVATTAFVQGEGANKLNSTSAAPAFSTSSTYAVGDHVTYNGALYRCTTAVSTAGAWTGDTNWTADTMTAMNVALKGNIPYTLGTPTVIDTASSETVEGETVYYGSALLANRTANILQVTASTALDELRITFPAATSGKVRDFGLRVEVGDGTSALTAPALVPPAGVTLENSDGTIPALADGTATAKGVTLLYFSETAPGVFVVKGEQVEEVA